MNKETTADIQPSYWYCDRCERNLNDGETRYNCTICTNYDYCEQCMATADPPHAHQMVPELAYGREKPRECMKADIVTALRAAIAMYSDRYCMGTRDIDKDNPATFKDSYSWLTFQVIGDRAKNFGHGLRQLIEPRAYLGICAANRPEWMITDLACIFQGIVSVPIYTLFTDSEVAFVVNNTRVSVIVCDKEMLPRFVALRGQCPSLQHIVCMDPISNEMSTLVLNESSFLHYMAEVEKNGSVKKYDYPSVEAEDALTIIYTSGSSGFPKGAIVSEGAFRATFPRWCLPSSIERVTFSYRPLAWAADRDAVISTFLCGGRTGFFTRDPSRLMEELALVRPTNFSAAPAIWNKIYNEFHSTLALLTTNSSLEVVDHEEQRLLKHFAKLMPNRCRDLTIGGAMVSPAVLNFMKRCFTHCSVNESYGISEVGSVAYNDLIDNAVHHRLESVPHMGYTTDDKPYPRGELLVKTPQMFSGYVNNAEETAAVMTDDGFFRTGDIVELRTGRSAGTDIRVIDRKKNFFKLAQGQFVSPEHLQSIYLQSPFVEQIYIHGDLLSNCVMAVIVPNRPYAHAYAQEHHLAPLDTIHPSPLFRQAIRDDLRRIGQRESLRQHEIPSHIVVDFEPFTPENGLLTSSMKPCRHKLAAHYAQQLRLSLEQQLADIIETTTGRRLNSSTDNGLLSTGADSLSAVRLSRLIESDLGISLPVHILFDPQLSLHQLATLVQQHPSHLLSHDDSIVPRLLADADIDLDITVTAYKSTSAHPSMVFITGTTGFVGAFLLSELLTVHSTTCRFVCLVRCDSAGDPLERIRESMAFYGIWKDEYREQIVALRGDLAEHHFGLDEKEYGSLAEQVDVIYHCGAGVNFVLPYHRLYGANVNGTREIIRLATHHAHSCIPIHYISTMSVVGSDEKTSPAGLSGGYAQSKWVAEKLISRASAGGVQVVIYRLGLIIGDSRSGACNARDLHTMVFAEMMKTKCYPQRALDCRFSGLPVDYTTKVIVALSGMGASVAYGNDYDVQKSSNVIILADVIEGMRKCGVLMEEVSNGEWKTRMKDGNDYVSGMGDRLFESVFGESGAAANEKFSDALSSFQCPSLDQKYLNKWMDFILHSIIDK